LQERTGPKEANVSCYALLSIEVSRFLIKTFACPLFLILGSRWETIILIAFPFKGVKFRSSIAFAAAVHKTKFRIKMLRRD
jgi:hypothetical protein